MDDGEVRRPVRDHTMERKSCTNCPWPYFLIKSASLSPFPATLLTISFRLLFKFALKIPYGSIAVENADLIPPDLAACY